MLDRLAERQATASDHAALAAACKTGVGLCTIVGIDGSFSRAIGAQLAVRADGSTVGSLSDNCLEAQLVADMRGLTGPKIIRYGRGSDTIDFRLPCGGGLDIMLDPRPDHAACRDAIAALANRAPASLPLPTVSPSTERSYIPALKIVAFGEGQELAMLGKLATAMGIDIALRDTGDLSLGQSAQGCAFDRWTAAILLFHDHEWELPLLEQVLESDAFYIGAQGGETARIARTQTLIQRGLAEEQIARIRSPIGLIPACKTPESLALSALAEIVAAYERMRATAR